MITPGSTCEHGPVDGELNPIRLADVRDRLVEQPYADERQQHSKRAADAAEDDALDKQLTDDAPA
jgi:hypothetical protein